MIIFKIKYTEQKTEDKNLFKKHKTTSYFIIGQYVTFKSGIFSWFFVVENYKLPIEKKEKIFTTL
jgi:hypothetical protein